MTAAIMNGGGIGLGNKDYAVLLKTFREGKATPETLRVFRSIIRRYFQKYGRSLPWRETDDPYHILVSEFMLQQTTVDRVQLKYRHFLELFPDFLSLAEAPLESVLSAWQGLGYNRRALALWKTAQTVAKDFGGVLPSSVGALQKLPGIGESTAAAVAAFAFNKPVVFIETNIRRVFIHFFFHGRSGIADAEILPFVEKTLVKSNPRDWYSALMDYGSHLGRTIKNPNRRSAHYQKQPCFEGSRRQLRGRVLKAVIETPRITRRALEQKLLLSGEKVDEVIRQLQKEGFLRRSGRGFAISQ